MDRKLAFSLTLLIRTHIVLAKYTRCKLLKIHVYKDCHTVRYGTRWVVYTGLRADRDMNQPMSPVWSRHKPACLAGMHTGQYASCITRYIQNLTWSVTITFRSYHCHFDWYHPPMVKLIIGGCFGLIKAPPPSACFTHSHSLLSKLSSSFFLTHSHSH